MQPIAAPLLQWFQANKRLLPFRQEPSAYHIWVSEIMLQQTRVAAAIPYYNRFIAALPTPADLAVCEPDALRKLWQGLGYYNRVNNMQKAARIVCEQYGGDLPADYDALRSLPGIGDYTAGAIASIAFGIPAPAHQQIPVHAQFPFYILIQNILYRIRGKKATKAKGRDRSLSLHCTSISFSLTFPRASYIPQ